MSSAPTQRGYEKYAWRLVDGAPQWVKVAEGFTAVGQPAEVGETGYEAFKRRIQQMLAYIEHQHNVLVVQVCFERQEPKTPYAKIDIELPAARLPACAPSQL